ncbi:MAG: arylsulfatase [Candidatus Hydrogenedentota bacterium]
MTTNRPNILLLMTDQQRFDSLGCYGVPFANTPNLDHMAAQGVVYQNCYVNNPICTPSRASLFTGKHLPQHGVLRLHDNLSHSETLFPARLKERGYTTALFGKLHVSAMDTEVNTRHPKDGFDVYEPCLEGCMRMDAPYQAYARWLEQKDPDFYARLKSEGRKLLHPPRQYHMTHWAAERTVDYLTQRAAQPNQPFFCMMSIFEPHNPYEHYPLEMAALVKDAAIPDPVTAGLKDEPSGIQRERTHSYLGDIGTMSPGVIRKMRHGYHASVAYADLEFGRVLTTLQETGMAENTLVIFTSDHGDMLGDHQLLVKGAYFFDPNVRVPLILRWPNAIPSARRIEPLVQLHDLAATILSAAGVESSELVSVMPDAYNLLPLATGEVRSVRDHAVCCYRNSGIQCGGEYWSPPINATMLRSTRYKLNVWHDSTNQGELYDMTQDPMELDNLWHDETARTVRDSLTLSLSQWLAEHGETELNCAGINVCD